MYCIMVDHGTMMIRLKVTSCYKVGRSSDLSIHQGFTTAPDGSFNCPSASACTAEYMCVFLI